MSTIIPAQVQSVQSRALAMASYYSLIANGMSIEDANRHLTFRDPSSDCWRPVKGNQEPIWHGVEYRLVIDNAQIN